MPEEAKNAHLIELESQISRQARDVEKRSEISRLRRDADLMKRSGAHASVIMTLAGMVLIILNGLVLLVTGWPALISNAVLVCLMSFGYLSGLSLVIYGMFYRWDAQKRSSEIFEAGRHAVEDRMDLLEAKQELRDIHALREISSHREGPWAK